MDLTSPMREVDTPPTSGKGIVERITMYFMIVVPFLALLLAIPAAWGGWLGWSDVVIALSLYLISGLGITVGYHRYFTHGSFKAIRPLRVGLAVAGSIAIQGAVIGWVADHRRHHAFSDAEGDPHSPWRFGDTVGALMKGLVWAHIGWLFNDEKTDVEKYAPDLRDDKDIAWVSNKFPAIALFSMFAPPVIGGLMTWSLAGALTAFFWGSLVRVAFLHHITWSINSICHTIGERPFNSRDKSGNVWWLAIPSFGESWHNLHHADPTSARHGALPGQIDASARVIHWFERLGWAHDVRWPTKDRLEKRLIDEDKVLV